MEGRHFTGSHSECLYLERDTKLAGQGIAEIIGVNLFAEEKKEKKKGKQGQS